MTQSAEPRTDYVTSQMESKKLSKFFDVFCITAAFQGRLAYLLMSVHAVNPSILKLFTDYNPKRLLFTNMVYGIAVMIFHRPSMRVMSGFHRLTFSILGSLMFNHASLLLYDWLKEKIVDRPVLLTIAGLLGGRIMILHLLAYLYHVDSRYRGHHLRPYAGYESMYRF